MKQKNSFPGILLPSRKQNKTANSSGLNPKNDTQLRFGLALLGLWFLVFLFSTTRCNANSWSPIKEGQKLPDVTISNLLDYPSSTAKLSDFRGKLLILDFWDIWCGSCIEGMPEIAALNRQFKGRIQIISVNANKPAQIAHFLSERKDIRDLGITMALHDSVLSSLFPHKLMPHIVWISPDGIYLGATTGFDLKTSTIKQLLDSGKVVFQDPKNDQFSFSMDKPLFENGNGGVPRYLNKSFIAAYQPGLPSREGIAGDTAQVRIHATNVDLYTLYLRALAANVFSFPPNRMVFKGDKPLIGFRSVPGIINHGSLFCYELICRGSDKPRARRIMLNELNTFFGLDVRIERQAVNCYVLSNLKDTIVMASLENKQMNLRGKPDILTQEITIYSLKQQLEGIKDVPPVVLESEFSDSIKIAIDPSHIDLSDLNRQLAAYGLVMTPQLKSIDMMIISPDPGSSLFATN